MPSSYSFRPLILALLALSLTALLWVLVGVMQNTLNLWHELRDLPGWVGLILLGLIVVIILLGVGLAWRIWRPRPRRLKPTLLPTRPEIEQRLAKLQAQQADATQLQAELLELDRRRDSGEFYVALFGEISTGKSSLIRALAPTATPAVDVLGGTTRTVTPYHAMLESGRELIIADVPGTHEVNASAREAIARDEALRAHAVIYLTAGDLTRDQDSELRWLTNFGKPILLTLNKIDQLRPEERTMLEQHLRKQYGALVEAVLTISAGGQETIEQQLVDGTIERQQRASAVRIDALRTALQHLSKGGSAALEPARAQAVLAHVSEQTAALEVETRQHQAQQLVTRYTQRAVIGALAAVAPGTDLVIQGTLAAGLIRELADCFNTKIREIDINSFLQKATLNLRTSTSIVLAIAGNALKAFPGLGTLGGGVLHAIAYGLIFDSLGRAVVATLTATQQLDQEYAAANLKQLLTDVSSERVRRIAQLTLSMRRDDKNSE